MWEKRKKGKCRICSKIGPLTYEHVPPRKAFNSNKALVYYGRKILEQDSKGFPWEISSRLKGKQLQRGIGAYTLCERCNNNTGAWYGDAFVDFIRKGYRETNNKKYINNSWATITLNKIYPLRIIKQIMAMFFSINNPNLSSAHEELREFVLSKEKRGISEKDFGFYLYILRGKILKRLGIIVIGNVYSDPFESRVVSELSTPPFGLVLEFQPKDKKVFCDITFFANEFDYDQEAKIKLTIPVYGSNSWFPLDYRTREQILNDYIKDRIDSMINKKLRNLKNR
jgi:5-methylcytosine-specific restriction endonuclease McrA